MRRLEFPFGTLVVRTSAFAPFFGDEERKLLYALGSLTSLALDRARLFTQERPARESLERIDELKSQFVALAAHELRSPVGAIYGLSETLAERAAAPTRAGHGARDLADPADPPSANARGAAARPLASRRGSRRDQAAARAGTRAAGRNRQRGLPGRVRSRSESRSTPSSRSRSTAHALDRIVTNLIVNACRYGAPPVMVSASAAWATLLRVTVQDHGPGVPAEFVPLLFDRFARCAASASNVPGTGLGLAIARSYARAHSGEISYRPAASSGSVFELTLPTPAAW